MNLEAPFVPRPPAGPGAGWACLRPGCRSHGASPARPRARALRLTDWARRHGLVPLSHCD